MVWCRFGGIWGPSWAMFGAILVPCGRADGPGRPQGGAGRLQQGPSGAPDRPQGGPRRPYKFAQTGPNVFHNLSQERSGGTKRPPNSSRAAQGPSGRCFGAVLFHHSSLKRGCGTILGLRGCSGCCFGAVLFHHSCLTESCGTTLHGTTTALLRRPGGGVCRRQLDICLIH